MTVITKNNKEIELWINSKLDDLYLKKFLSKGISALGIGKDSIYDIFKNNNSFYISSHIGSDYFFGKIVSVKVDDEVKYEDKSNNPSSFNYLTTLKSYNLKHSIDLYKLDEIKEYILEDKNNLKELFNPNFVNTVDFEQKYSLYLDSIIHIIESYKDMVNKKDFSSLTPFEIRTKIERIMPIETENWHFKHFTFSTLARDFEEFLTEKSKSNLFDRIYNKIEEKKPFIDFN